MANSSTSVRIDDTLFNKRVSALRRFAKVNERDFVKEQGALFARDIAKVTPPIAGGVISLTKKAIGTAKDKKQGELALYNDLLKIVSVVSPQALEWASKEFGNGYIYKGKDRVGSGVILDAADLSQWHIKNRNAKGRTYRLSKSSKPWVSNAVFMRYYNTIKKRVGKAKAVLSKAMKGINASQVAPAWVTRNEGSVKASGSVKTTIAGFKASIKGKGEGIEQTHRHLPFVNNFRRNAMIKRLGFIVRQTVKQSGFKTGV